MISNAIGNQNVGGTVSGGNLYYPTALSGTLSAGTFGWQMGNSQSATNPIIGSKDLQWFTSGSAGIVAPINSSALSGTWRALTQSATQISFAYCSCNNFTRQGGFYSLWVRIS